MLLTWYPWQLSCWDCWARGLAFCSIRNAWKLASRKQLAASSCARCSVGFATEADEAGWWHPVPTDFPDCHRTLGCRACCGFRFLWKGQIENLIWFDRRRKTLARMNFQYFQFGTSRPLTLTLSLFLFLSLSVFLYALWLITWLMITWNAERFFRK